MRKETEAEEKEKSEERKKMKDKIKVFENRTRNRETAVNNRRGFVIEPGGLPVKVLGEAGDVMGGVGRSYAVVGS